MDKNRIQLGDIVKLDGLEKAEGKDITVRISAMDVEGLGVFAEMVEGNAEVKVGELEKITEDMKSGLTLMRFGKVNYFGDELTASQYEAIRNLAQNTGICRQLANVTDPEEARKIETPRLTYLPHQLVAAASRAAGENMMILNWLENIDLKLAEELGKHYFGLSLGGVREITPEVARALTLSSRGMLSLENLSHLSKEVATELVKFKGERLYLSGLQNSYLPTELATILARYEGVLQVAGLHDISFEVAKILGAGVLKGLSLPNLTWFEPDTLRELLKGKSWMNLTGLVELYLKDGVLIELAKFKGELSTPVGVAQKIHEVREGLKKMEREDKWRFSAGRD